MKKNSPYSPSWTLIMTTVMMMVALFLIFFLAHFLAKTASPENQLIIRYYGSLVFTLATLSFFFYQVAKYEVKSGRVYMSGYNLVASGRLLSSAIIWVMTISNFILILFWVIAATLPNFFPELYTKLAVKVLPISILLTFIMIIFLIGTRYNLWSEKNLQRD